MPLIQTKANASAQGFGLFARAAGGADGTVGIFALGCSCVCGNFQASLTVNKYTYSTDASIQSSSLPPCCTSRYGSAAGNCSRIMFAIGKSTTRRTKYTYSTCSFTTNSSFFSTVNSNAGSAVGNNTRGIFCLGCQALKARDKYVYASDTSTSSCGISSAVAEGSSAAGNSTRGIFAIGGSSATRNKYTYACDTSTATGVGSASISSKNGAATGNSTRGIFALGRCNSTGFGITTRNKYTYACCSSTASGVASSNQPSRCGSAAGNSTRGIFALGNDLMSGTTRSTTRNKYTYACDTSTATGVGVANYANRAGEAASFATGVNT